MRTRAATSKAMIHFRRRTASAFRGGRRLGSASGCRLPLPCDLLESFLGRAKVLLCGGAPPTGVRLPGYSGNRTPVWRVSAVGGEGGPPAGAVVELAGVGGREGRRAVGGAGGHRGADGLDGLHDLPRRATAAEAAEAAEPAEVPGGLLGGGVGAAGPAAAEAVAGQEVADLA